jgi:RHS repeat-associated protein
MVAEIEHHCDTRNPPASASAIGNPYLYTGQRWDPETDNHYYKNRYQRPTLGRFISRDPLEYVDGLALYVYVSSRALAYFDPYGQEEQAETRASLACPRSMYQLL